MNLDDLPHHSKLAAWINARGLKAQAFGALVPINKDVVSRIINGKRKPTQEVAERIERITGGDISASGWF
jgi:plasmid maintenance system antidote protein VapI